MTRPLEEMSKEFGKDHRIADVRDEELVETQHPGVGREAVGNRLQRIGATLEIFEVRVHAVHEPVEVKPPFPGRGGSVSWNRSIR